MAAPTPLYTAIIIELERRRQNIGLPMERVSQLAGTADRSYSKILSPETASGRLARWETLELIVDVLFAKGYEIRILPSSDKGSAIAPGTLRQIIAEAADFDRKTLRERMIELGVMGRRAQLASTTPAERKAIARKAAKARWQRRLTPDLNPET